MNTSIKLSTPCELINVTSINPLISKCQIKVCWVGDEPNRNGSVITKETAVQMANSLPGSPIVGFFNENTNDFEEHNRIIDISGGKFQIKDTTMPYGFVDLNAQCWFQDYLDGDKIHTYLVTEGYIWTGQYPETNRILVNGNNQSMELDESSLNGHWAIDDNSGMEFFIINDAIISKLCILGEDFEPCFEGANITKFSLEDDFNLKITNLMKEVRKLKGGSPDMEDIKDKAPIDPEAQELEEEEVKDPEAEVKDPVADPEVEDPEASAEDPEAEDPEEETPADPEEEKEEKEAPETDFAAELDDALSKDIYIEVPVEEFQNLKENYSALETQYNELQDKYSTLETSYNELVEFKATKDREAKQEMIDSFYMLSEEDKADVQTNIDKYSIDEIESKLSVICVRNKLDLSGSNENNHEEAETTFSLVDSDNDDESVPALVSALRKAKKNN